ncbi:MAG TPA: PqqD family protein [Pyrinomonadaceae bacterium]|nr:PqqD family protein [Pyrinomonadaceae bacterium]
MSESVTNQPALRALDHVVSTDFEGGEGVLVDLNTRKYYRLNETAMLVWRGLENGRGFDEIVEEMTGEYEVTPERARESVEKILNNFRSLRLAGPR